MSTVCFHFQLIPQNGSYSVHLMVDGKKQVESIFDCDLEEGSALVQAGLDHCRELGFAAVVVLGHPTYYPRFGFSPSSQFRIDSEYDVPEEVFMAMELKPEALSQITGRVRYHPAFGNV